MSELEAVPVGRASALPVSVAMTSTSRPTLPPAMTGASVSDFTQPARPRSDPSHSGVQKRRVDTWNRPAPADRKAVTRWPSSSLVPAILAS